MGHNIEEAQKQGKDEGLEEDLRAKIKDRRKKEEKSGYSSTLLFEAYKSELSLFLVPFLNRTNFLAQARNSSHVVGS